MAKTQQRQIGEFKVIGSAESAVVRSRDGRILEEFNNSTTTNARESNAFKRAERWAESQQGTD